MKILSYLSLSDRQLHAALVSKRWKAVTEASEFWRYIELPNGSDLSKELMLGLLQRSDGIRVIDLTGCGRVDRTLLGRIFELSELKRLFLQRCLQFFYEFIYC